MSRLAKSRRFFMRGVGALLIKEGLGLGPNGQVAAQPRKPSVHVFLQIDAKSSVIEKALQEHLPSLSITVFGRFRDFEEVLASAHPDAILCIAPVLDFRGVRVTLQGMRAGQKVEPYVLASAGQPLEGPLSGRTIGIVDMMGREGTESFLNRILGAHDVKVKRVSKIEDLLPLLEFSAADGVVSSAATLSRLAERTRIPIKTRSLPEGDVGLPAVAVLSGDVQAAVVAAFQNLDPATNLLLGVDAWSVQ